MSNQYVVLTLPQFSSGPLPFLLADTSSTFCNKGVMTGDPFYANMFLFSNIGGNDRLFLTRAIPSVVTTGTTFKLQTLAGNETDTVTLIVTPPSFSVSSNVTLYRGTQEGLPITLTPPTTVFSPATGLPIYGDVSLTRTISGYDFSLNGYFVPALSNIGLTSTTNASGIVTISGIPSQIRLASNYTYYVNDSRGNQMRTTFSIQIQPGRFTFSNVSGFAVSNGTASATLSFNRSTDLRILASAPIGSATLTSGTLPTGVTASLLSGNTVLRFSGTPTAFLEEPAIPVYTIRDTLNQYSSTLALTFSMSPALTLIGPSQANVYQGQEYTKEVTGPIATYTAQYYPSTQFTPYSFDVSNQRIDYPANLVLLANNVVGAMVDLGYNASPAFAVRVTVCAGGLTAFVDSSYTTISDAVTFSTSQTVYNVTQNYPMSITYAANASSGFPMNYTTIPTYSGPPGTFSVNDSNFAGTPTSTGTFSYTISAACVGATIARNAAFATISMVINVCRDVVTFTPSPLVSTTSVSKFKVIQGRDIEFDYTAAQRTVTATASSGVAVDLYELVPASSLSGRGLTFSNGLLAGTPTFTGTLSFAIRATVAPRNASADTVVFLDSLRDQLILASPASLDFVAFLGDVKTCNLIGYAYSASPIVSYSLSGAPSGVSITSGGTLTLQASSYQAVTPFEIRALTAAGITLSRGATFTVNDATVGEFLSPPPTTILFPTQFSTYPVVTDPTGLPLSLSGTSDLVISGSNVGRISAGGIYPPVLVTICAGSNLIAPFRAAHRVIEPTPPIENTNWIQYVPIDPIQLAATGPIPGTIPAFSIPVLPHGITWNPITSTLAGSPRFLSVGDAITAYASDGFTVAALSIPYSVRTPRYLRGFSSPSAFTNYVRQLAIVNSAVHALDCNAVLPDPLIATQTGPYPPDVVRATCCKVCKVATPQAYDPRTFWTSFSILDWQFGSVYYVGAQSNPPYTYLQSIDDFPEGAYLYTSAPTLSGTFTSMGGGPRRVRSVTSYGYRFSNDSNVELVTPSTVSLTRYLPVSTLSYGSTETFAMAFSNGTAYYIRNDQLIGEAPLQSVVALGILASEAGDGFQTMSAGSGVPAGYATTPPVWAVEQYFEWDVLNPANVGHQTSGPASTIYTNPSYGDCRLLFHVFNAQPSCLVGITSNYSVSGFYLSVESPESFAMTGTSYVDQSGSSYYMEPGTPLGVAISNSTAYYLRDGNVIGSSPCASTTGHQASIQSSNAGDYISDILFEASDLSLCVPQLRMPYPTNKWSYTTQTVHSITHTAATTDTLSAFPVDVNSYSFTVVPYPLSETVTVGATDASGNELAMRILPEGLVRPILNGAVQYSAFFSFGSQLGLTIQTAGGSTTVTVTINGYTAFTYPYPTLAAGGWNGFVTMIGAADRIDVLSITGS